MNVSDLITELEKIEANDSDAEVRVKTHLPGEHRAIYDVEYTDLREVDDLNSTIVLM